MESNKVMLLSQIMNSLIENYNTFQRSYVEKNKESFETSKKALLELQRKINLVVSKS